MNVFLAINTMWVINGILALILLGIGLYELYIYIQGRRSAKMLSEEEFKEGMRKAQVIDVRERDEFNAGHILGARNIPYTVLTNSYNSIRKDQPIYLYERKKALAVRTAIKLKKQGYQDINILKDGFTEWTGKTKAK